MGKKSTTNVTFLKVAIRYWRKGGITEQHISNLSAGMQNRTLKSGAIFGAIISRITRPDHLGLTLALNSKWVINSSL